MPKNRHIDFVMEKRFLTVAEVATYLGMSEDAIRKWVQRGYIPASNFGRSVRFDIKKIDLWAKGKECYHIEN